VGGQRIATKIPHTWGISIMGPYMLAQKEIDILQAYLIVLVKCEVGVNGHG
jgi:hypothetical protein